VEVPIPPGAIVMSTSLTSAMVAVSKLDYGELRKFAVLVKSKVTRQTPSEADFINAIYEATVKLSVTPDES